MAITNSNPPKKNQEFWFSIALTDATTGRIKTNPTIAAGDFVVWTDYVSKGNLDTLPDVEPNSSSEVRINLSADEMNGDVIHVQWVDQTSPNEWEDGWQTILTTT